MKGPIGKFLAKRRAEKQLKQAVLKYLIRSRAFESFYNIQLLQELDLAKEEVHETAINLYLSL
jgi:hypothetical protein